jgi:tetratricopeptide (TPR) repeat protein
MSKESGAKRTRRLYALTPEALAELRRRVDEEWLHIEPDRRLTQADAARLMGVSKNTARKIVERRGNDRSVLEDVFRGLGLELQESQVTEVGNGSQTTEPADQQDAATNEGANRTRRRRLLVIVAAAIVTALAVVGFRVYSDGTAWRIIAGARARTAVIETLEAGQAAYQRGDFAEAGRHADAALEVSRSNSLADAMADALRLSGDALAAQGRLEDAVRRYEEALPLWKTFQITHGHASLLEVLGVAEARLDRLDRAEDHLANALQMLRTLNDAGGSAGVLRALGSIAAVRGDMLTARQRYAEARAMLVEDDSDPMKVDIRALEALLLRDDGHFDEALGELRQCLEFWRERGHPRWQAATLMQIASVHRAAGNESAAGEAATAACALYDLAGDDLGHRLSEAFLSLEDYSTKRRRYLLEEYF